MATKADMNTYVTQQLHQRSNSAELPFVHCTAYQFARFSKDELPALRAQMKEKAQSLEMLGTILLGQEGINFFLSGSDTAVLEMVSYFFYHMFHLVCVYQEICLDHKNIQKLAYLEQLDHSVS